MKKIYTLGATVAAGLMALALSAQATTATFPRLAANYTVWFARAMDPCDLATSAYVVSVTSAHMPPYGCTQQNSETDATLTLKFAKLTVTQRGKLMILGIGLPHGAQVGVQLDLRFTVPGVKAKQYTGAKPVTFEDQRVNCPGFTARGAGVIVGSTSLATCLGSDSGLQLSSNIEILGARLINLNNNKPFAEAGVVR